jgi:MFS family permease
MTTKTQSDDGISVSPRRLALIVLCGCLICLLTFGPRSAIGLFMQPMSTEFSWSRDVFSLAFALQNLLWGIAQPICGSIADRYGSMRVISMGALAYAAGLLIMNDASSPLVLNAGMGVLIGLGLSGCSFSLVLAAFGKLLPVEWRALALGAGTAAGSFGQFIFAPVGVALIDTLGWAPALKVFAGLVVLVVPLSFAFRAPGAEGSSAAAPTQGFGQAMREAFSHRSYVLLIIGFFTCGFQLAFITMHLPAYLVDQGLSVQVGGWVIALIGLFNIFGSLGSGWLANDRVPKRYLLVAIYLVRAVATLAFVTLPTTPLSALLFGVVTGLAWLSAIPPTSGLVAVMFGTRWLSTLWGIAFLSHQVGGFLGALLGGLIFERFGSYLPAWWLSVALGIVSALINLPIVERPIERVGLKPA